MINDYFDTAGGVDTQEYTRALYAPHPILAGMISKRGLALDVLFQGAGTGDENALPPLALAGIAYIVAVAVVLAWLAVTGRRP